MTRYTRQEILDMLFSFQEKLDESNRCNECPFAVVTELGGSELNIKHLCSICSDIFNYMPPVHDSYLKTQNSNYKHSYWVAPKRWCPCMKYGEDYVRWKINEYINKKG